MTKSVYSLRSLLNSLLIFLFLTGSAFPSSAQSTRVRYYESKDAANLAADLISASDGDVFILTTSGGRYALDSWLNISAKVSIQAGEDLAERPVLTNRKESNTVQIMRLYADGCAIHARGIEFDSESRGAGNYPVKYAIRTNPDIGSYSLVLEDCYFHGEFIADNGSPGSILRMYNGTFADSIILRNCIFEGDEGIVLNSSGGDFSWDTFRISNCTFLNMPDDQAIQIVQKGDNKTGPLHIDHCTFVNVGGVDEAVLLLDSLYSARVTNSIFGPSVAGTSFLLFGDQANQSLADYINVFDCPLPTADQGGVLGMNTWNEDPGFADLAAGDLTLGNEVLYDLGSDGLPLGDLRWADVFGPAVNKNMEALSDSTLLLRFDEWVDTTLAEMATNYELSGSAGFTGSVKKAELYNFHAVRLTLERFGAQTGKEIAVTVSGVEDLKGNVVDLLQNTASYVVEALYPTVSAEKQTVSNGPGQAVGVRSNLNTGFVWLILQGESVSTLAELEAAVSAGKGARAAVDMAYTDTEIPVYGITPGLYDAFASDAGGLVSEKSENSITILDGIPPVVTLDIQGVYNGEGDAAIAQSNEPGKIYLIRDGEKQDSEADFMAAVELGKGAYAPAPEANLDVEIPTEACLTGIYFAYAIDLAGNISTRGSMPVNIMESTVSAKDQEADVFRVYAAQGKIFLDYGDQFPTRVSIYDLTGRVLVQRKIEAGSHVFPMERQGIYILTISSADQRIRTFKLHVH